MYNLFVYVQKKNEKNVNRQEYNNRHYNDYVPVLPGIYIFYVLLIYPTIKINNGVAI